MNRQKREERRTTRDKRIRRRQTGVSGLLERVTETLEIVVAVIVLLGFCIGVIPLLRDMPGLLSNSNDYTFHVFLEHAFNLVIGIEFIRMLIRHTPGSALEVLVFAIARHMVLDGGSGLELLLSVVAIGAIFAIRRYLYISSFDDNEEDSEGQESEEEKKVVSRLAAEMQESVDEKNVLAGEAAAATESVRAKCTSSRQDGAEEEKHG